MVSFDKTITDRSSPPEPGTKLVPASAVQRFICRKNFTFSKEKAAPPPPIAGYMDPQDSDDESRSYPSDAFEASVNDRAGTKDRSGSKASGSSAHFQASVNDRAGTKDRSGSKASGSSAHFQASVNDRAGTKDRS
eukprot:CAMPEP_0170650288 /NCGR_PEP_ID=MMETSP0224-20130122/45727_1 /TAXON_ID=285029 /ORGANISM="Togula jolla, Strain CCCM 725" /LENGTH=134 /DNA_ID=CAMNT_0010981949 /DNA_START=146 /DNA_END=547 /DNA_ORIENTATION=-